MPLLTQPGSSILSQLLQSQEYRQGVKSLQAHVKCDCKFLQCNSLPVLSIEVREPKRDLA